MAYKISILNYCDSTGCTNRANYRVHNRRGSGKGDRGEFCKMHADKRVRELNLEEEETVTPISTRVQMPR